MNAFFHTVYWRRITYRFHLDFHLYLIFTAPSHPAILNWASMGSSAFDDDSPLSITASVAGILTFLVAAGGAIWFRVNSLRSADVEYERVKTALKWYRPPLLHYFPNTTLESFTQELYVNVEGGIKRSQNGSMT